MGAGGDARPYGQNKLVKRIRSSDKLRKFGSVKDDLIVLKSIWLNKASGQDHAARLESFYGPQAHACKVPGAFAFTSGDHLMARSTRDQLALQTIDSEVAFCGAANRFLQHALRGFSITAMT
jgi:hypothetical protein